MPARPAAQVQPDKIVPAFTIPALPQKIDLDEEIREAFLADASDLFERIEPLVLGLGRDADPRQSLRELGRCFHTLKGAAGSVGLADLATLVHALEEHLEETSSPASADLIDVLHQTLGYLDGLIGLLRTRSARTGGNDRSSRGFRSRRGRSISTTVLEHRPPGFHPRAGAGHRAGPERLVLPGILIRGRDRWLGVRGRWADPRTGVPLRRADGPGIRADRQAPALDRSGRVAEVDFQCRSQLPEPDAGVSGPAARSRPGTRESIAAARCPGGFTRPVAPAWRTGRRPGGAGRDGSGRGLAPGRSRRCTGSSDPPALGRAATRSGS